MFLVTKNYNNYTRDLISKEIVLVEHECMLRHMKENIVEKPMI